MTTKKAELIVSLVDRLSAPARALSGTLDRLTAAQNRNSARLDAMRGRLVEAGAVAYGLARALSAPIRTATEFETKLEDIAQKIDAPVSRLPELGKQIRAVARDTTQSASDIADGMDVLTGMGASGDDALAMLGPIGRAATAYNASIADLSQASYAALDNLKVPALEVANAIDIMAQSGKEGAFELKDMARHFPTLGAAYAGLGQQGLGAVADLSAALQVVRKGTGDSASAATNLNNILQKITAPQTVNAFKKMGVNLEKELGRAAEKGLTPLEAILEITDQTLKGDLGKLGYLFADAQVQQGMRPLLQNMEEYRRIRAEALKAQGVVEEDYKRRLLTGAIAARRFAIAMENINASIGAALLPALSNLAATMVPIIDRMATFAENNPRLTQTVVALTAGLVGLRVAAIAAQFSLLWMKGGLITAAIAGLKGLQGALRGAALVFTPVTAGFRAIRSAIIGYTAAAAAAGHGAAMSTMASSMMTALNPLRLVTAALRGLKFVLIGSGIGAALVGLAMAGAWIYQNWDGIKVAFEAFKGAFDRAIQPIGPALEPVVDGFNWLWEKASALVNVLWDITGPIDEMNGGWAAAGVAIGKFVGETLVKIVELPAKVVALSGEMLDAGAQIAQSMWDGVTRKIDEMIAWFTGLPRRILDAIGNIDISSLIKMPSLPSWLGGGGEVEARATGGPVSAGRPYLIGERGPELMVPRHSGFVLPNHMLGGGASGGSSSTTHNNVHAPITVNVTATTNADANSIASQVGERVQSALAGHFSDGAYA